MYDFCVIKKKLYDWHILSDSSISCEALLVITKKQLGRIIWKVIECLIERRIRQKWPLMVPYHTVWVGSCYSDRYMCILV